MLKECFGYLKRPGFLSYEAMQEESGLEAGIVEDNYVNIASYAYQSSEGTATIQITINKEPIQAIITFMDNGLPFNPLLMEAPDTTLSAENRPEGGLGIFMVKNIMDDIKYMYEGEKNILTMCKNF